MMAAEVSDNLEHFFETDERPTRADVFLEPMGNDSGDESGNEEVYSFDNLPARQLRTQATVALHTMDESSDDDEEKIPLQPVKKPPVTQWVKKIKLSPVPVSCISLEL
uniref:Uncharacterized protein n=1 Tax=Acrobeloides nanus TaxID=290746 RepID=A0A914E4U8_9BILA